MKNTSVTPSATFDQMPRPSQSQKIGARTTRGNALAIFTKGSNPAAISGWRANQKPTTIPPNEPIANPRIDSHKVMKRCFQITPLEKQSMIWLPTSIGLEKKKGGSSSRPNTGTVASNCHTASATTATSSCSESSPIFDTPRVLPCSRQQAFPTTGAASPGRRLRVTLHDLVLQDTPDFAMKCVKIPLKPDFRNIPGTRQRHRPIADDARAGSRRHDHYAVSERDRFLEVVGDEQHCLAIGAPQVEQQVADDLPRLRVERPEWLVHQQDPRIPDQYLREADALSLSPREHVRVAGAECSQADGGQPGLRALKRLGARRTLDLQPDGDVVDRSLPGKQRVGLKQVAGVAIEAGQRRVEDFDRARGRFHQASGDVEQGRFSAPGRPDDGDELAMIDPEPGLFDSGIEAIAGQTERHRRVIERDRRWFRGDIRLQAFSPARLVCRCGLPPPQAQFKPWPGLASAVAAWLVKRVVIVRQNEQWTGFDRVCECPHELRSRARRSRG